MFDYFPDHSPGHRRLEHRLRIVVTGIRGFVGSHVGRELRAQGHYVVGADWERHRDGAIPLEDCCDEFYQADLRTYDACHTLLSWPIDRDQRVHVFHLASSNSPTHTFEHARDTALMSMHMMEAARVAGVDRFLLASAGDAWPAEAPEPAERVGEEACKALAAAGVTTCRIARFRNVYGPRGAWYGGKEGAAAALCRRIAGSADGTAVTVDTCRRAQPWVFVEDVVEGLLRAMASDGATPVTPPLALCTVDPVCIEDLARIILRLSGKSLTLVCSPAANSEDTAPAWCTRNTSRALGWQPTTPLHRGIAALYSWVADQVASVHPDARVEGPQCAETPPRDVPPDAFPRHRHREPGHGQLRAPKQPYWH